MVDLYLNLILLDLQYLFLGTLRSKLAYIGLESNIVFPHNVVRYMYTLLYKKLLALFKGNAT
jgi:hypothetical protein